MTWDVLLRPEVEEDISEALLWYEERQIGLGEEFLEELIRVMESLAENAFLSSRRHPSKNIRWKYADRFPYRVIYEVLESEQKIIVAAVLHAARHDQRWRDRF
jgi:plasmid stabilization system protein ParE